MRKRERENPCGICGHYHKFEEGEVCGHRRVMAESDKGSSSDHASAFPTEILPHFLYLGSYDNASRSELLKTLGVTCILNTAAKIFTRTLSLITAFKMTEIYNSRMQINTSKDVFIPESENNVKGKARVLVHSMLGTNRSPAIVIAYLMKSRGWRLSQSYQWVKEKRPLVELTVGVYKQLQEYEEMLFGPTNGFNVPHLVFPSFSSQSFSFGTSIPSNPVSIPAFNGANAISIFSLPIMNIPPQEFTFGANQPVQNIAGLGLTRRLGSSNCGDISMDIS